MPWEMDTMATTRETLCDEGELFDAHFNSASTEALFEEVSVDAPFGSETGITSNNPSNNVDAVVFNSPSKNGVGGQYSQLARHGVSRRAPNVNYNQLIVAGSRLASVTGSQSNEIQNAIYTMHYASWYERNG